MNNNVPSLPPLQPAELQNDAVEIPVVQMQQQQPEGDAPPLFIQPPPPHEPSIGDIVAAANNNINAADDLLADDLMGGIDDIEDPDQVGRDVGFVDGSVAISKIDTSNRNQLHARTLVLFGCNIKVFEDNGSATRFKFGTDLDVFAALEYALGKNHARRGQLNLTSLVDESAIQNAINIGFTGRDVAFIERVVDKGRAGTLHTMKFVHLTTALWSRCPADFCEKISLYMSEPYIVDQLHHPFIIKQLITAGELGLMFFGPDAFLATKTTKPRDNTNQYRVRLPCANILEGNNQVLYSMQLLIDLKIVQQDLLRKVVNLQIESRRDESKKSYFEAWKESCDVNLSQTNFNTFTRGTSNIKYYSTVKSLTNFALDTIRGDYQQAPNLPSWAYCIAQRIGPGDVIVDNAIASCLCRVFLVDPNEDDGATPSIVFTPNADGMEDDGEEEEENIVVDTDYFLAAKAKNLYEIIDGDFHPLFAGKPGEEGTIFDRQGEDDSEEEEEEDVYLLVSFVSVQVVNSEQVVVLGGGTKRDEAGGVIEGEVEEWYLRATNDEELSDVVEENLFAITSYGPPPIWYEEHPYLQVLRDRLAELEALSNEQQANVSESDVAAVSFETDQGVNASESGVEEVEMDEQQNMAEV